MILISTILFFNCLGIMWTVEEVKYRINKSLKFVEHTKSKAITKIINARSKIP